jgi:hypothetical protein
MGWSGRAQPNLLDCGWELPISPTPMLKGITSAADQDAWLESRFQCGRDRDCIRIIRAWRLFRSQPWTSRNRDLRSTQRAASFTNSSAMRLSLRRIERSEHAVARCNKWLACWSK